MLGCYFSKSLSQASMALSFVGPLLHQPYVRVTGPDELAVLAPPQASSNVPPTPAASTDLPVPVRKSLRVIDATMISAPLCGRLVIVTSHYIFLCNSRSRETQILCYGIKDICGDYRGLCGKVHHLLFCN